MGPRGSLPASSRPAPFAGGVRALCRRLGADTQPVHLKVEQIVIKTLKEVFDEAAQLSEDEQSILTEVLKEAIATEKRWQTLFQDPRSDDMLREMVADVLAADVAGETEEIVGDSFLS